MSKFSHSTTEEIAIIGLSCRFPGGADSPNSFWSLLENGTDSVTEIPEDRWDQGIYLQKGRKVAGKSYSFAAGTLGDISTFDADFFGISPREAEQMDPQQRLLLELAWEALESGGQIPEQLNGKNCAVYVGISSTEYVDSRFGDHSSADAYFMLGSTLSIAANRISYIFDFKGPSMAIDTACSSSIVALNEAIKTLTSNQAEMALVGGVNLLLTPFPFIGFSQASMLSHSGRCRTFDESADGYVRSEGGGVVVLKPLKRALEDGDPIQAVIAGTGVNAAGRTKGISVPSFERQKTLIERVLKRARINPEEIDYFEAHGTGTTVGDPIEARAIGLAVGQYCGKPLPIGSVKSNIGHLESASGMAGLIKAVLILRNRAIPPTIHVTRPNPSIDFEGLNLRPALDVIPLESKVRPLHCCVNSFGFGGTNATAVLREAPIHQYAGNSKPSDPSSTGSVQPAANALPPPLFITARSDAALREMALRIAKHLDSASLYDTAYTLATHRQFHNVRAVVRGRNVSEIKRTLTEFSGNDNDHSIDSVVKRHSVSQTPKVGFVFSGNGSHWEGMGRQLYKEDAAFREEIDHISHVISDLTGWSVVDMMLHHADEDKLQETRITQPLLFAIQCGICASLKARGVKPAAVAGHSVGEIAAAYTSGALSLEQAAKVIVCRSDAQSKTRGLGRMAAAEVDEETARDVIAVFDGSVEIAAINGPSSVTFAGDEESLIELQRQFNDARIPFFLLDLDYAFHSKAMDKVKNNLLETLSDIQPNRPKCPLYSTVTGKQLRNKKLDNKYWWQNIRQPVQFRPALDAMIKDGVNLLIEIGPKPILQSYIRQILRAQSTSGEVCSSLSRNQSGSERIDHLADEIFTCGGTLNTSSLFPVAKKFVPLPSYPWQRERFWFSQTSEAEGQNFRRTTSPLLGYQLVNKANIWEFQLDTERFPSLVDHKVGGDILFPATGFIESLLECSRYLLNEEAHDIQNFEIRRPIVMTPDSATMVRVDFNEETRQCTIHTRKRMSDAPWTKNAVGRIAPPVKVIGPVYTLPSIDDGFSKISAASHYGLTEEIGLQYGPTFQGIETVWIKGNQAVAHLYPPLDNVSFGEPVLHPASLDSALQVLFDVVAQNPHIDSKVAYLPTQLERLRFFGRGKTPRSCHVILKRQGKRSLVADFLLFDKEGVCTTEVSGFRFLRADSLGIDGYAHKYFHWQVAPLQGKSFGSNMALPTSFPVLPENPPESIDTDDLAVKLVAAAIAESSPTGCLERPDVHGALALSAPQTTLFHRVCAEFERKGLLSSREDGCKTFLKKASDIKEDAEVTWRNAYVRCTNRIAELTALAAAADNLGKFAQGKHADFSLSPSLKDHFLASSPAIDSAINCTTDILRNIIQSTPFNRKLRVLEVGAHVGLLAGSDKTIDVTTIDYVMMSADTDSLAHWEAEALKLPNFSFLAHNLSQSIDTTQQSDIGIFDIVVCPMISLETPPNATFWENLKKIIHEGTTLIFSDPSPSFSLDLVFGHRGNWWRSEIDPNSPPPSRLLNDRDWQAVLENHGFTACIQNIAGKASVCVATLPTANNTRDVASIGEPRKAYEGDEVWLLVPQATDDSLMLGENLAELLKSAGRNVVLTTPTPASNENERLVLCPEERSDWQETFASFINLGKSLAGIVFLTGKESSCRESGWHTLTAAHALNDASFGAPINFHVVTWNAQSVSPNGTDGPVAPDHAALWGTVRVIRNEFPQISCNAIDLMAESTAASSARELANIMTKTDVCEDIILRPDGVFGLRLLEADNPRLSVRSLDQYHRLEFTPGKLDKLSWVTDTCPVIAPDQVVIEPRAVGLNFRDVMFALGILPEEALERGFAGPTLGMEASGIITTTGSDVTDFQVGDEVLCFAPACLASQIVTSTRTVARKPNGLNFWEAASIPTAFFTVYYALHHLAELNADDRILIHGAAGGVGLAALQYADYVGAEVYVSAGTDEKRQVLKMLGVPEERILDSRSLRFAEDILRLTNGEGVDVILNSLAGEAISANLRILKPFGRFLELGKRDFYENSHIGLKVFRNNLSFYGIDADQLLQEKPNLAHRLFTEMVQLFEKGVFHPLPYRRFSADQITNAFRYMQQSKQIGKIVISPPAKDVTVPEEETAWFKMKLDPAKSYLVTGGLSGFGIKVAKWLADKGASNLVLISRSGPTTVEAKSALSDLEKRGCNVIARACDVTSQVGVEKLIQELSDNATPLGGVVHAAAVFQDALIANLDHETYDNVLAPKVYGAEVLNNLTWDMDLDFFILFSSITTAFGNPSQVNYVTANSYLEGLAARRRALGKPAICVGWGAIGDAGYLTRNTDIKDSLLQRLGTAPLTTSEALETLEAMIACGRNGTYVGAIDWGRMRSGLPGLASKAYEYLVQKNSQAASAEVSKETLQAIKTLPPNDAKEIIINLVKQEIAKVLKKSAGKIDSNSSIFDLGMDSLMALELRLGLEELLTTEIPTIFLSEGGNISDLSIHIYKLLTDDNAHSSKKETAVTSLFTKHAETFDENEIKEIANTIADRG